jgi:hypothetical protein
MPGHVRAMFGPCLSIVRMDERNLESKSCRPRVPEPAGVHTHGRLLGSTKGQEVAIEITGL